MLSIFKDKYTRARDKEELLLYAAETGNLAQIKKLLDKGVNLECRDRHGYTPLLNAAANNQFRTVEYLLARNANFTATNNLDLTALSLAAYGGFVEIAKLLLDHGANLETKVGSGSSLHNGRTPLGLAACKGHSAMVTFLLSRGADPYVKDQHGNTAFTFANYSNDKTCLNILNNHVQTHHQHHTASHHTPRPRRS